jgi:hypothetical protein
VKMRLHYMKTQFAVLLLVIQLGWAQQPPSAPLVFGQDTLDLGQKPIMLSEVVVGNSTLSAEELVMAAKEVMSATQQQNMAGLELLYFLRYSDLNDIEVDFKLKKTTVDAVDDDFIARAAQGIPKQSSSHTEALYRAVFNDTAAVKVSTQLVRGFQLEDESTKVETKDIEEFFLKEIERSREAGHYFKIKSGIFGAKVREDDIDLDDFREIKDSLRSDSITDASLQKRQRWQSAAGYQRAAKMARYHPHSKDPVIAVFEKPKRFDFQLIDYTLFRDQWVHVVAFKEKSKAEFYGELWISEEDKGLLQFKFVNNKPLQSINLLGFTYREPRVQGQYFYKKTDDQGYRFYFGRLEQDTEVGVDRPLSFIEKRKAFIGGRKVNRIDLDIHFALNQTEEYTYILKGTEPVDPSVQGEKTQTVLEQPESYPTDFWKDTEFTIAPSEAMRSFQLSKTSKQGER